MSKVWERFSGGGALGEGVLSTTRDAAAPVAEATIVSDAGINERGFYRDNGVLRCDGTSLDAVADAVGTPADLPFSVIVSC